MKINCLCFAYICLCLLIWCQLLFFLHISVFLVSIIHWLSYTSMPFLQNIGVLQHLFSFNLNLRKEVKIHYNYIGCLNNYMFGQVWSWICLVHFLSFLFDGFLNFCTNLSDTKLYKIFTYFLPLFFWLVTINQYNFVQLSFWSTICTYVFSKFVYLCVVQRELIFLFCLFVRSRIYIRPLCSILICAKINKSKILKNLVDCL